MIDDVIFLGAGASAAEGAPLQRELFKEFFEIHARNQQNGGNEESLKRFFKDFFGIDVNGHLSGQVFPTFEEVLGILDLAKEREESFRRYSATEAASEIHAIRQNLIYLIARTLKEKLSEGSGNHKKLVQRLKNKGMLMKTAFISLNYDILIDNALVDLHPELDLDYGIDFTNFKIKGDWHSPAIKKAVQLYKIHGSLNWLYCPACVSVKLTPKIKSVATLIEQPEQCDKCKSRMEPIIVPPTFFKGMSNFYLRQIWRRTEEMLINAKRIYFCGYSFPDADIHIKYMLKRVEVNSGKSPEVYVINNPRSQVAKEEKEKYLRFWSQKTQVRYLNLSFQEFCQKGINDATDWGN